MCVPPDTNYNLIQHGTTRTPPHTRTGHEAHGGEGVYQESVEQRDLLVDGHDVAVHQRRPLADELDEGFRVRACAALHGGGAESVRTWAMAGTGLGLLDTAMLISVRSAMHATAENSQFVC